MEDHIARLRWFTSRTPGIFGSTVKSLTLCRDSSPCFDYLEEDLPSSNTHLGSNSESCRALNDFIQQLPLLWPHLDEFTIRDGFLPGSPPQPDYHLESLNTCLKSWKGLQAVKISPGSRSSTIACLSELPRLGRLEVFINEDSVSQPFLSGIARSCFPSLTTLSLELDEASAAVPLIQALEYSSTLSTISIESWSSQAFPAVVKVLSRISVLESVSISGWESIHPMGLAVTGNLLAMLFPLRRLQYL